MEHGNWVWVCPCGAHIQRGPAEPHEYDAIHAHVEYHDKELAEAASGNEKFTALLRNIVPRQQFPPPYAHQIQWTNLDTGDVDAQNIFVIQNPAYEAFELHGGTPYQIEPLHDATSIRPLDRIDRAIQDVHDAMGLLEQCEPPL